MLIRTATVDDASLISSFIAPIAKAQIGPTLTEKGLDFLLAGMKAENQVERIRNDFQFFIGTEENTIVGVVAIRPPGHLYYLFVGTEHQRMGFGRQLWYWARDFASNTFGTTTVTVNSSLNAIAAYERFGFSMDGPIEELQGVRYLPMCISIEAKRIGATNQPMTDS